MKYVSAAIAILFLLYVLWRVLRDATGLSLLFAALTLVPLSLGVAYVAMRLLRDAPDD